MVIHADSAPVGEFECSNSLFNRIRTLVRWAQQNNMVSIMTDCPHRERLGWLEEDHLNGPALRYEFDLAQLFTKTMNDIADSQLDDGLVPDHRAGIHRVSRAASAIRWSGAPPASSCPGNNMNLPATGKCSDAITT